MALPEPPYPRLTPDSPTTCPVPMTDIVEYLRTESDTEVGAGDLAFHRTAQVGPIRCWTWTFTDVYGDRCYASVAEHDDRISVAFDADWERSVEEYLLDLLW